MIRVKEWDYLRMVDFRLKGVGGKAAAKRFRPSPTYLNFGRPLKSCDIILYIEILTRLPILPASP